MDELHDSQRDFEQLQPSASTEADPNSPTHRSTLDQEQA
jgi:hypothetical protein